MNYKCITCMKVLHSQQVLDKGFKVEGKHGSYYESPPRHKVLIQEHIGGHIREEWHAVSEMRT